MLTDKQRRAIESEYIGMKVKYRSGSGKEWDAIITNIPENPEHACTTRPTVSLIFKNERGKYVKKRRVLPIGASTLKTQVWIYTEGKHDWKDGKFVVDEEELNMLTTEQKRAIVNYIIRWSTKDVFESLPELSETSEDENWDKLWEEVSKFLNKCSDVLNKWVSKEVRT